MKQGSANVTYVHQDHLSGTSVMTDSNGASLGSISYAAFGPARSGSVPTDIKFTGQRLDGTGLYYYGARYYDPVIGRFISPDSIVPDFTNPQAFNRYSYVVNNPLKYIDPTGHDVFDLQDIMATEEAGMPVSSEVYQNALDYEEFKEQYPEIAREMEESEQVFTHEEVQGIVNIVRSIFEQPKPEPGLPLDPSKPATSGPPGMPKSTTKGGHPGAQDSGERRFRSDTANVVVGSLIFGVGALATTALVALAASEVAAGPPGWLAAMATTRVALFTYWVADLGFQTMTSGRYALPYMPRRLP